MAREGPGDKQAVVVASRPPALCAVVVLQCKGPGRAGSSEGGMESMSSLCCLLCSTNVAAAGSMVGWTGRTLSRHSAIVGVSRAAAAAGRAGGSCSPPIHAPRLLQFGAAARCSVRHARLLAIGLLRHCWWPGLSRRSVSSSSRKGSALPRPCPCRGILRHRQGIGGWLHRHGGQ